MTTNTSDAMETYYEKKTMKPNLSGVNVNIENKDEFVNTPTNKSACKGDFGRLPVLILPLYHNYVPV